MTPQELRQSFLSFFEKRGHAIVPSSSLLPTDPSVLFTTAGMQQFKDYFVEGDSPYGKRVTTVQKCFRTSDIEEVGDETHLTLLEMLGNFSFGDYFKEEAIQWAHEFLVDEVGLDEGKLWLTVFEGDDKVPEDTESRRLWEKRGFPTGRIHGFDKADNFWGPTGEEGPCGPTTEVHYELHSKPCGKGKKCLPNCDCGRFVELWNLVLNEYYMHKDGNLEKMKKPGVDTGMGFDRLMLVIAHQPSPFETELFQPIIAKIEELSGASYADNLVAFRVIADHARATTFIAAEGVLPSNTEQGYILRRLIRRAIRYGKQLNLPDAFLTDLVPVVVDHFKGAYPELTENPSLVQVIEKEAAAFTATLERGMREFEKIATTGTVSGEQASMLYETYGFPFEMTTELAEEKGITVDQRAFEKAFEKHRDVSRQGAVKKFGGVGIDLLDSDEEREQATKLHTATHLLHSSLRNVLGEHVQQMGSDITPERLRFDFSHPEKLTKEEKQEIEDLVNKQIKKNVPVTKEIMEYETAIDSGALAFFKEKYPDEVSVYQIGDFSREICGGPHVAKTGELGAFRIAKEKSSSAGVRRIKAVLE